LPLVMLAAGGNDLLRRLLLAIACSPVALGLSTVRCTKPVCPKEQRAVRRPGAPKIWAYGCNVTKEQSAVDRCCVEREICMRTCGMHWDKCSSIFDKCTRKTCGDEESCISAAEAAEVRITGGDSHMTVCKAYRDTQRELCECLPLKAAKEGATARLTSFYAAHRPDRLNEDGQVRDVEEVWKKWHGREAELFFELARKYSAESVEFRSHSEEELARWRAEAEQAEELARRRQDEEERLRRAEEEELARRQAADELASRQAEEEELARSKHEEELSRRHTVVAQLRAEKASAIASEDFLRAKALKAQILELDPKGEL